jgi:hypothetical protein
MEHRTVIFKKVKKNFFKGKKTLNNKICKFLSKKSLKIQMVTKISRILIFLKMQLIAV